MSTDKFEGSDNSGSPIGTGVPNLNNIGDIVKEGEAPKVEEGKDQVKELESLIGRQGEELGQFRKFFSDIEPLLDNLDKNPDIVRAILDGKVDSDLAKAALEGKVSISDAQIVSKAHEEVKKDLGEKGYEGASPEEVNKLVEERAEKLKQEFDVEFKRRDDLRTFETNTRDFISRTPDFEKYATDIDKWLDKHDEVTEVSVAYHAVKGELSENAAKKQAEVELAEANKKMALNTGGGSSIATHIGKDEEVIDSLIAAKSNPNNF